MPQAREFTFIKCWQTRLQLKSCSFKTVLLKLALLSALAREKWILLFRHVWRENQANQPRKLLKQTTSPSFIQIQYKTLRFVCVISSIIKPLNSFDPARLKLLFSPRKSLSLLCFCFCFFFIYQVCRFLNRCLTQKKVMFGLSRHINLPLSWRKLNCDYNYKLHCKVFSFVLVLQSIACFIKHERPPHLRPRLKLPRILSFKVY